jgi:glycosyltransferase involved in cell wall biosynthesis
MKKNIPIKSKNIIYIGGFNFVTQNASSIRVFENALFLNKLEGYECSIMGKIDNGKDRLSKEGIDIININLFQNKKIDFSINPTSVIEEIEKHKVNPIVIAYNYPTIAFCKIQGYCRKNDIFLISDITEWHGIDGKFTLMKLARKLLVSYKMRFLNKKCEYLILATPYLSKFYKKGHQLILPFVTIKKENYQKEYLDKIETVNFVFAGTLGGNFSKDRLDIIIKSFVQISKTKKKFLLHVIGPPSEELMKTYIKRDIEKLKSEIIIYGRLDNTEVRKIIKKSDFVIFARDIKRITKVGFPTKVFEAFSLGVPTITNNTSSLDSYIKSGVNGFLVNKPCINSFKLILEKVLNMSTDEIREIKTSCRSINPFYYKYKYNEVLSFLEKISKK